MLLAMLAALPTAFGALRRATGSRFSLWIVDSAAAVDADTAFVAAVERVVRDRVAMTPMELQMQAGNRLLVGRKRGGKPCTRLCYPCPFKKSVT